MRKCRIGTAKFFTLLLLLYHTSIKPAGGYYLYTTATCPNCRSIKPILKEAGILFEDRYVEEHLQEATVLGLTQAPTLVVQGDPPAVYAGVIRIKEFLKQFAL